MKKIFLILLTCIFLLIFVSLSLANDKSIKLMWWQQEDKIAARWQAEFERFEAETGIHVEVELLGWSDMFKKLTIAFAGKSPEYDVLYTPPGELNLYASKGFLEPLNDRITADLEECYVQGWKDQLSYDGKIYALPKRLEPRIMFYNKEIFKEAGVEEPPVSWNEVVSIAKTISNNTDHDGFTVALNGPCPYQAMVITLNGSGGKMFTEDGAAAFNGPEGIKAVKFLKELLPYMPKSALQWDNVRLSNDYFIKGNAGITFAEASLWPTINNKEISNVVGKVGYAIIPGDGEKNMRSGTRTVMEGLAISKFSKNKDAAWEFIKWATTDLEDSQKIFDVVGYMPGLKGFYKSAENPFLETAFNQFLYPGKTWEDSTDTPEIKEIIRTELQSVFYDQKTPEQALNDAAEQVNKLSGISK